MAPSPLFLYFFFVALVAPILFQIHQATRRAKQEEAVVQSIPLQFRNASRVSQESELPALPARAHTRTFRNLLDLHRTPSRADLV